MWRIEQMFCQLQHQIAWQNNKLMELERSLAFVIDKLSQQSSSSVPSIGSIEYRFDQLKVEKLEGALHIGIAAGSDSLIDQFTAGGKEAFDIKWTAPDANYAASVRQEEVQTDNYQEKEPFQSINRFITEELPKRIDYYATTSSVPIDAGYRDRMIHDLRRQVEERTRHYLLQEEIVSASNPDPRISSLTLSHVADKVIRDIEEGVRLHVNQLQQERGG